ncbi:MAG TPA: radical SAM protein [bacterium]|nr:radical SAM protein [bacterium]HPG44850.1 radical SAM protein [bacterium]HPM98121.1 radical SAM protein [bacterium]
MALKSAPRPALLVSDSGGKIFEIPQLQMIGMRMYHPVLPDDTELIPLPNGSNLFHLPERIALAYDPRKDEIVQIVNYRGNRVYPVAAFLAPAYTQLFRAAFLRESETTVRLPLYAYAAVGWRPQGFFTTAIRVDADVRQDLDQFDEQMIERGAEVALTRYPNNRLVRHLVENCVRRYGCPAARNFVLGRWECPAPVSPSCNARCVGCISHQQTETGVTASQERIAFIPSVEEIAEFTVDHLRNAPQAVVSFGQGCEGEPLTQGLLLEESITAIRKQTDRGTINLNSNASKPLVIERLCRAGLDSLRVSVNSVQPEYYERYYRPRDYSFADVIESIRVARKQRIWISLNYFIFPGFTDREEEIDALLPLLQSFRIDMIQMRNLNMDPDWMIEALSLDKDESSSCGIRKWMERVRQAAPWIRFGYFNPALQAK